MTFEEEWAQLKSSAAAEKPPGMQLAGYNTENRQGSPDGTYAAGLTVRRDDLGAVGHDAYLLLRGLQKFTDIDGADLDSDGRSALDRAARELDENNFKLGDALRTVNKMWGSQRKTLQQGCARISNHLDYTKGAHAKDDHDVAASLRDKHGEPVSTSQIYKWIK